MASLRISLPQPANGAASPLSRCAAYRMVVDCLDAHLVSQIQKVVPMSAGRVLHVQLRSNEATVAISDEKLSKLGLAQLLSAAEHVSQQTRDTALLTRREAQVSQVLGGHDAARLAQVIAGLMGEGGSQSKRRRVGEMLTETILLGHRCAASAAAPPQPSGRQANPESDSEQDDV
eukprot:CAMPEP_0115456284 /NCGR_PEP_ID=MMETSP0271-20121206/44605_1 /TAXON_ID=71861 /ORGANISM="Scrippsiella trochoidea, Strain CCMP3099" /LENGTH=174 /DNA_ID=CAMNT_0002882787 /DNA_START=40 /DNA_END=565 /DNA_ORIENTATION=+